MVGLGQCLGELEGYLGGGEEAWVGEGGKWLGGRGDWVGEWGKTRIELAARGACPSGGGRARSRSARAAS